MWGPIFGITSAATTRLGLWAMALALWLLTRPGGWAVLAAAILVGLKLFPEVTPVGK
ncbi:MAG TPA: hypothetical protein VGC31_01305 [Paenirhodobacter sp.]